MRRILASISNRGATGDITTLANPDVVEKVRELHLKEKHESVCAIAMKMIGRCWP